MQHAFTGVADVLRAEIGGAARHALPEVGRRLWTALAAGTVTEAEAEALDHLLARRTSPANGRKPYEIPTVCSQRPARPRPTESLQRRRRWAAAGYLPPRLAHHFTVGELAALSVIAEEIVKRRSCTLCHGHIAALAGVSISTVKRAIRAARLLGLVAVRERRVSRFRSDSNVVTIVSTAWITWLQLGPKNGRRGGGQARPATDTGRSNKGRQRAGKAILEAIGGVRRDRRGPMGGGAGG